MKHLVFILSILVVSSVVQAQTANYICKLGDTTKLFVGQDGAKYSAKLSKGVEVVLKDEHGKRWMVKTQDGRLGFIKTKWLTKVCAFREPPPAHEPEAKSREPIPTNNIAETMAALDVSQAVAETSSSEFKGVAREQAKVIEKNQEARLTARQRDCLDQTQSASFRVAVYNLKLLNLPESMGRIVSDALLDEVRKLEGISAIGMAEIEEMLQHEVSRQTMGCEADDACLAEIAGALGVDEIVTGSMSEEADGRQLLIRRIDQGRAEVVTTINQRLNIGNGEEFLLAIGPGVEKLYPERKNRPGTQRGVPEKLLLRLNPPPIDAGVTWSTMATAALSLALGGTFAYLSEREQERYVAGDPDGNQLLDAQEYRDIKARGDQYLLMGNVSFIAGGTLSLVSGIMSLFTDWDDISEEATTDE